MQCRAKVRFTDRLMPYRMQVCICPKAKKRTYTLISSTTLSSTSASVVFSSIPSTYTDLAIRASVRSDSAGTTVHDFTYRINGLTTSIYSKTQVTGNGSAAQSYRQTTTRFIFENMLDGASATTNTFSNLEIYIPSYAAAYNKQIPHFGVSENNATLSGINAMAGYYIDSTAISQLEFYTSGYNFVSGSTFYLYGIKNS